MDVLEHKLDENIEIVKFFAKSNKKVRAQGMLFKYKVPDKSEKLKDYRAKTFQTVIDICVSLGKVPKNTAIMKCKEGCLHPIVAFGLCTECGKDLKDEDILDAEKNISMLHAIPQVSVSISEASELGMSDILHQLKRKKLTLVVDLDQTLIHTSTTDNIPEGISGVFHFTLSNKKFRYSTRLRPGTEAFLRDMSSLYEMHVYTMGARDYADTICSVLDPKRKYFSSRILSRDECFDNHSKVPKLQALFPKGDKLVMIIDDRFDMWSNCANLIRVKPYHFFEDVGDINDPNKRHSRHRGNLSSNQTETAQFKKNKPLDMQQTSFCFRTARNNIACIENVPTTKDNSVDYEKVFQTLKSLLLDGSFELALLHLKFASEKASAKSEKVVEKVVEPDQINSIDSDTLQRELASAMDTQDSAISTQSSDLSSTSDSDADSLNEYRCIIKPLFENKDKVTALSEFYVKYIEDGPERHKEREQMRLSSPLYQLYSGKAEADEDRYLETLGKLLKKIHKNFYEEYKETRDVEKLPDTKVITPRLREVCTGQRFVFSGIIPTNYPNPQNHPIWCAAKQMGATVSMTLTKSGKSKTTHLVSARSDTGKVHQALKLGIKIVTEHWLWRCFEIWENVSTEPYEWKGLTGGKRAKSKSPDPILTELNTELKNTLGDSVLEAMTNEVDEVLANGSDSDYSSPTDSEDSEAESLESNDLTGPPDPVQSRKRSRSEVEEEEEAQLLMEPNGNKKINEEEEDDVSDNSMEGEMIQELEAELTEQLNDAAEGNWHCSDD